MFSRQISHMIFGWVMRALAMITWSLLLVHAAQPHGTVFLHVASTTGSPDGITDPGV